MSAFPPEIAQVVRERRGGIGVNGGRDAYNSWTFFFSRKKGEGEKEEASHAHVITNAAGIHDPASPRPSTPPRLSATTSHPLLLFSRPPELPGQVQCTRAKRGPTTKREERKTFSTRLPLRSSSFTEPQQNRGRCRGGNDRKTSTMDRLVIRLTPPRCFVLLKNRGTMRCGKSIGGRL